MKKRLTILLLGWLLLAPSVSNAASWKSFIQAWMYPGAPACNALTEIADGRTIDVLKPQYYINQTSGILRQMTTSTDGCNGYDPSNVALVKQYSREQYVTVASNRANMAVQAASSTLIAQTTSTLVSFVVNNDFEGVDIDYEGYGQWTTTEYANFKTFITGLGNALHANGKKLMVNVPGIGLGYSNLLQSLYKIKYEEIDALPVDYIVVLAYDYQYDYGAGESVAPTSWVNAIISWAKTHIGNQNKIVLGLPSYGYHGATAGFSITIDTKTQSLTRTASSTATRNSDFEMNWANGGTSNLYQDTSGIGSKRTNIESQNIQNISVWHLGGNDWFASTTTEPMIAGTAQVGGNLSVFGSLTIQ